MGKSQIRKSGAVKSGVKSGFHNKAVEKSNEHPLKRK